MIPRILHQTVKDKQSIPPDWQACQYTWIQHLGLANQTIPKPGLQIFDPDGKRTWEFRLWDDQENDAFVQTMYPQYHALYRSLPKPINRVDMVRYLYLHAFGGFYVDMDCKCLKSIEPLLNYKIVLGEHESLAGKFVECAFMGSVPNHPFWIRVVEAIKSAFDAPTFFQRVAANVPSLGVLTQTGPLLLTQVVKEYVGSDIKILTPNFFYPDPRKLPYPQESFVVHMFSGSWVETPWEVRIFKLQQTEVGRFLLAITCLSIILIFLAFLWWSAKAVGKIVRLVLRENTAQNSYIGLVE